MLHSCSQASEHCLSHVALAAFLLLHAVTASAADMSPLLQTVADLGTISEVNIQGAGGAFTPMVNTYGAAWEISNQPGYPISLEVTSGSQTVSNLTRLATGTSRCHAAVLIQLFASYHKHATAGLHHCNIVCNCKV